MATKVACLELVREADLVVVAKHLIREGQTLHFLDNDYLTPGCVEVWSCLVPSPIIAREPEPELYEPMVITLTMNGNPNDEGARYNASTAIECWSEDDAEFAGRDFARYFHALQRGMNQYWKSTGGTP